MHIFHTSHLVPTLDTQISYDGDNDVNSQRVRRYKRTVCGGKNVEVLSERHGAALIAEPTALNQAPAEVARPWTRGQCIA